MEALFKSLDMSDTAVIHRRVANHVRRLIAEGRIKVGDKLPPGQTMAEWMGVDASAVQVALSTLAREGVLTRTPRRGTVVAGAKPILRTVSLFDKAELPNGVFTSYLRETMLSIYHDRNVEVRVWRDNRSAAEQAEPWDQLLTANRRGEFQAVAVCSAAWPQIRWLSRTGIPYVVASPIHVPNRVFQDLTQGMRLAVRALAEQGCRSLGAIMPLATTGRIEGESVPEYPAVYEAVLDAARHHGMSFRDEWIRSSGTNAHVTESFGQERFGYSEFRTLWKSRERPDGLIAFPETTARGVLTAVLELGVKIPRELHLVLHRSLEIPMLCPVQATFVVSGIRQLADAMVQTLDQRLATGANREEPVLLPFALMTA